MIEDPLICVALSIQRRSNYEKTAQINSVLFVEYEYKKINDFPLSVVRRGHKASTNWVIISSDYG